MTLTNKRCDGKNCQHEFDDGEEYVRLKDGHADEIFCTRECALTVFANIFEYWYIGDES
jgi:hypothetical protein